MNNNKSVRKQIPNNFQKKAQCKNHAQSNNETALRIHSQYTNVDNISLDSSASGKSDLDMEYHKYKPDAVELRNSQIIEIDNNKGLQANDESLDLRLKNDEKLSKKSDDNKCHKKVISYSTDTTLVLQEEDDEKECCCWNIICIFCGN